MSLQVEYVSRLTDVFEPAVAYFRQPVDLFAKQQIVVPTAGVKAWLMSEVAKQLGTSGKGKQEIGSGEDNHDAIKKSEVFCERWQ